MGLGARLFTWNERVGLGVAFDSSAGFTFSDTGVRGPDAAWILKERWEALPQADRERFAHVDPDFVAELRSPSDSLPKMRKRMRAYRKLGVRLAWLIDPKNERVEIYRPGRPIEVLDRPPTLSGEDVLPGFVLDLKGILYD
jgi:Uma2 family endonuclease